MNTFSINLWQFFKRLRWRLPGTILPGVKRRRWKDEGQGENQARDGASNPFGRVSRVVVAAGQAETLNDRGAKVRLGKFKRIVSEPRIPRLQPWGVSILCI